MNKKYYLLSKENKNREIKKIIIYIKKKFKRNKIIYIDANEILEINKYLEKEFFYIKKVFILNSFSKKIKKVKFNMNKNNIFLFDYSFKNFVNIFKGELKIFKSKEKKVPILKKLFINKKKKKNPIKYYKFFFKNYIVKYLYIKKKFEEIFLFLSEEIHIYKNKISIKFPYNNIWDYIIEKYITLVK
ncbi:hypothetical protein ACT2CC_00675 [Candidatus Vidania fulgoroideorum]